MKITCKIFCLLLITSFINSFHSQGLQLSFSGHYSLEPNYQSISCINHQSNHILFQSKQKSKFCDLKVSVFSEDLDKINEFKLQLTNEFFVGIRRVFDNIVLFTYLNNGTHTILRTRFLDLKSNFLVPKDIFTEPNISGYPSNFKIPIKNNSENLTILVELPFQSDKNEDIKILSLNSTMEVVKEVYNKLELKFKSKRDNRVLISNNGQAYLLKQFWKRGNHFYIYKLGQQVISEKEIKLNQRKVAALDYFFNSKNELVISGFYSSPVRFNYEGFFLLKFDSDLDLIHKNQYLLSENIVKSFKSSKEIKESGYGLDNFMVTNFNLDQQGNHFLLAEHLTKINSKKDKVWYSKGFILIKFNKNGNYIWGCPVRKEFKSDNLSFIGTFSLNNNPTNQYFFNELTNLNLKKGVPPEYGILNYSGTTNVTFSESGIFQEKVMAINFPGKDSEKYAFSPKQLNPYNSGPAYFVILNEKVDNYMLGLVK